MDWVRWLLFLPEPGSTIAGPIDRLHAFVISVTMLGATGVFLAAVYFIVRWKSRGAFKGTERLGPPRGFEPAVIGSMLALFLTWWAIGFRQYVGVISPSADATEVYVVGKQWVWQFDYPGGQTSLHTLYLPADRPVKLVMTSRDVIHSFFVPAFRLKMDAVPGRYTSLGVTARKGVYDIFCAEYCGASHSLMRGRVVVLPGAEYDEWLRGTAALAGTDLATEGERIAARKGCLQCHTLDGRRHIGPSFKDLWGATETLADGSNVLVDGAYLTESIIEPNDKLVSGYPPVMPSYRGAIDPPETAAILELLRSLSRHTERTRHAPPR
jgi:cytochrome c oxidase subunit II